MLARLDARLLGVARPLEAFLQGRHHVDHRRAARRRSLGGRLVAFPLGFDQSVQAFLKFVVIFLDVEFLGQVFDKLLGKLYFLRGQLYPLVSP